MTTKTLEPETMLPLTPAVLHILLALADGERHGYAIMQTVASNTDGQIRMGPGTLYGTIKRMIAADLIEESDERPDPKLDDERRRYYRLTPFGRKVLAAEVKRLSNVVSLARAKQLLNEFAPRGYATEGCRAGLSPKPCPFRTSCIGGCWRSIRQSTGASTARSWRSCFTTSVGTPMSRRKQ
jgi:DNA-binding PadR family transcriptional regulator